MPGAVPDIPGQLLLDPTSHSFLSQRVAELCGLPPNSTKFPGAQPVSMTVKSLEMLEKMDFWVCEKSDGVRVLVFIVMNGMSGNQEVWLVSGRVRRPTAQSGVRKLTTDRPETAILPSRELAFPALGGRRYAIVRHDTGRRAGDGCGSCYGHRESSELEDRLMALQF